MRTLFPSFIELSAGDNIPESFSLKVFNEEIFFWNAAA
jgi:hypothetical protein